VVVVALPPGTTPLTALAPQHSSRSGLDPDAAEAKKRILPSERSVDREPCFNRQPTRARTAVRVPTALPSSIKQLADPTSEMPRFYARRGAMSRAKARFGQLGRGGRRGGTRCLATVARHRPAPESLPSVNLAPSGTVQDRPWRRHS
jgi:hypothetical protein